MNARSVTGDAGCRGSRRNNPLNRSLRLYASAEARGHAFLGSLVRRDHLPYLRSLFQGESLLEDPRRGGEVGGGPPMKRDWSMAIEKCLREGSCRVCGSHEMIDPAHIIPRSLGGRDHAESIVPLCRACHTAYDAHRLSLLPYLTVKEEVEAVIAIGGLSRAYNRINQEEVA